MDTMLAGGDQYRDARGLPAAITGIQELIQRALIRLTVRKGSFALDPELGSELRRLRGGPSEALDRAALSYAQEALAPLSGQVSAVSATCRPQGQNSMLVDVCVAIDRAYYQLEVNAAR